MDPGQAPIPGRALPARHQLRGDGVIEDADRAQTWDTTRWPDGIYDVTVRAWDLKGNGASAARRVRVENKPPPK